MQAVLVWLDVFRKLGPDWLSHKKRKLGSSNVND
jgi:hypothetical protein